MTCTLGETVEQSLALQLADLEVVERDVVVDGLGVLDQTVVRDDRGAGVLGGLDLRGQLLAVLRADDDDLGAVGDHGLDLVLLLGDRVAGRRVLHVGLEAGLLETVREQLAREDPVLRGLVGQRDTDRGVGGEARSRPPRRTGAGVSATLRGAAGESEGSSRRQALSPSRDLLHVISFSGV